jgi:hypothetical protein
MLFNITYCKLLDVINDTENEFSISNSDEMIVDDYSSFAEKNDGSLKEENGEIDLIGETKQPSNEQT